MPAVMDRNNPTMSGAEWVLEHLVERASQTIATCRSLRENGHNEEAERQAEMWLKQMVSMVRNVGCD